MPVGSLDHAKALLSGKEVAMLRLNTFLANVIILPAGLLACQAGTSQSPEMASQRSPTATVDPIRSSLVLELDRAILVLKRGLKERWTTRDQYLAAFAKTPGTDPTGRPVKDAKGYVQCAIGERLRPHQIWDEGPPLEVEVQRTIVALTERRKDQVIGLQPSACLAPAPQKVIVSPGVASSMLKTRIDPVYPPEALKDHVSGIVVLHARISTMGGVGALSVISGPASLQQAALDAVRQWTYRPYLLNDTPVEVETTINVVFAPKG
jgi:TonB family protein